MHCLGGKERTTEDWAKVIAMASPDLKIGKIVSPAGKAWSLIEIVYNNRTLDAALEEVDLNK